MKRKLVEDVQIDSILYLPDDALVEIFKKFRPEIILSYFSLVCKRFFFISKIDSLWQFKQAQHFPLIRPLASQAKQQDKKQDGKNALTLFKERYKEAYITEEYVFRQIEGTDKYAEKIKKNRQNARLFSCVKEGDVEALKVSKITLKDFSSILDQSQNSLFDFASSLKHQVILDYIYELARSEFVSEDGKDNHVAQDAEGKTLLFWAAKTNQIETSTLLIKGGAKVDQADYKGQTPLWVAAKEGHHEMVKVLLGAGAQVDQADNDNRTPLWIAAENGHHEIVKELLGAGAQVDQANDEGETPLWGAAYNGHHEVVKLLIDKGANVHQADTEGQTPLYIAAEHGDHEIVKELLGAGAQADQADNAHETPLWVAAKEGHHEAVKVLLGAGAQVDQADNAHETPLWVAVYGGHHEVVRMLIEKGTDVNQANKYGVTPLWVAAQYGRTQVVEMLLEKNATLGNKKSYPLSGNKPVMLFENFMLKIRPADTLQEGIVLLKPNPNKLSCSTLMVNVSMIIALEKTYEFLTQVRLDHKEASAIRDLIDLIYTNTNKSFEEHVRDWTGRNFQECYGKNQDLLSTHSRSDVENSNVVNGSGIIQSGFFSQVNSKVIGQEFKTEIEILIHDLIAHSQLWSGNSNTQNHTEAASSMQMTNSRAY